ncbi:monocarboxylate transporter 7-like [Amphiura filiformis]|uniref:monocarboxylate transporter 7-like n=1 Tax=Amphiura filiformis TaxID=82378 RepID=UPI003B211B06
MRNANEMCTKKIIKTRKDVYPIKDHGWAWVVAFSAHVCRILHDGIVKSYGVMLPTLSFEFDTKVWEIGFAISLMVVVGSILVVIVGPIINRFQPRLVLIGLGVFVYLGFIVCACATSWEMFAFSLIVITGIPLRMCWYIMLSIQGEYFDKHYVIANSIAYSGSSVAVVILPSYATTSRLLRMERDTPRPGEHFAQHLNLWSDC